MLNNCVGLASENKDGQQLFSMTNHKQIRVGDSESTLVETETAMGLPVSSVVEARSLGLDPNALHSYMSPLDRTDNLKIVNNN